MNKQIISGIVWQPIDPQNLPDGYVVALFKNQTVIGGHFCTPHGQTVLECKDGYWYTDATHYAHITPIQLPTAEALEAEPQATAEALEAELQATAEALEAELQATAEAIEAELLPTAERYNAHSSPARVGFKQGFRAGVQHIKNLLGHA